MSVPVDYYVLMDSQFKDRCRCMMVWQEGLNSWYLMVQDRNGTTEVIRSEVPLKDSYLSLVSTYEKHGWYQRENFTRVYQPFRPTAEMIYEALRDA